MSVFLIIIFLSAASLAVDYGWMVVRKRQLQGITDRAAMAAVLQGGDPRTAAQSAVAADSAPSVTIVTAQSGAYNPDPAVAVAARFQPAANGVAAVQVLASQRIPLLLRHPHRSALRRPPRRGDRRADGEAAISVGSRLVNVQGGLPGMLLSQLAGVDLNLSVADYNALVGANVDLYALSGLLKTRAGVGLGTFDSTASAVVDLPTLVTAMADAATPGTGASVLRSIAVKLPPTKVDLARIVKLGDGTILKSLNVGADELLREALIGTGGDRQLTLDLGGQVMGVGSTKATVIIGSRVATSPWVRVGRDSSVTVSTSQIRIALNARIDVAGLGLATANLPVILEGAGGEARLASVACGTGGATVGVDGRVTPMRAIIGQVSDTALRNLNAPLQPQPATLLSVLVTAVTGLADVQVGGSDWTRATFTPGDIADRAVKTINTTQAFGGLIASLLQRLDLRISVLGLTVSTSPVTAPLLSALSGVAPALDGILEQVQQLAGVRIGQADLRVVGARCGAPALVG
ncbi:pilus assembly protein TadG-related protein [Sphingomonas sp. WKB10]|nr:pilus assembly protein TadG-related protein [Sphingomonas sp. WKB10]